MRKSLLQGALGKAINKTIEYRLKDANYPLLEEPFALRNEEDNAWRCEFWGKITRSAVTAVYANEDAQLRQMVDETVANLMATQTEDGCISSYPQDKQLGGWDIWGRKYALLTLMRYYEMISPDKKILDCCCKAMDHLMSQVGLEEDKKDILLCGWHDGLAASSILGAVVALWRLTKIDKYRQFADYIIERGCSKLGNVFEAIEMGINPSGIGNGKAYELTSCIQGLAELYLIDPKPEYKELIVKYYNAVLEREIYVTGVGGGKDWCGEFWYDCALRQTRPGMFGLGETCVTATWIHYLMRVLEITDDCKVADELEKSLYNGILGAMAPDGTRWVHINPTPLTGGGSKICADDQIGRGFNTPYGGNDCCRAQGPEGLVSAALVAVTEKENTVTVNLFEPLTSEDLVVEGNYPYEPQAKIHFTNDKETTLRVRTPKFLKKVTLNGEELPFTVGTYLAINKQWTSKDLLVLEFDFTLEEVPAPDGSNFVAIKRGPLVLAADSRGEVPEALVNEEWNGIKLCEYAVAGNLMSTENTITVWFKK